MIWIAIAAGLVGLETLYYLYFFSRLSFLKKTGTPSELPPVSVVICARNEADNLLANLPLIFDQDYPEFEVVIVDDCSLDETFDVLKAFTARYPNLKVIHLQENERFNGGKKFGITMGVKGASHERLVFTDADCKPLSGNWLSGMVAAASPDKQIVLGYSGFAKIPGLLNRLIRYDALMIGVQYLSYAKAGQPYMGVGRNLSYTKDLFFRNKGFYNHQHLASGDDDLFVNETANAKNTGIAVGAEYQTESPARTTLSDWFIQKRRHLTTGGKYRVSHQMLLAGFGFTRLFTFPALIAVLAITLQWEIILGLFVFRTLNQIVWLIKPTKLLNEKGILFFSPIFELALGIIYPLLMLTNLISAPEGWKRNLV